MRFAGTLRDEASDEVVFVLDGEVRMISRWTLDAGSADLLRPAAVMATSPESWDPLMAPSLRSRFGGGAGN